MKQARISAMESPGLVSYSLDTLVRVGAAMGVGVRVEFVPFSEMVKWEQSFSQDKFQVSPVENDARFLDPSSEELASDPENQPVWRQETWKQKPEHSLLRLFSLPIPPVPDSTKQQKPQQSVA